MGKSDNVLMNYATDETFGSFFVHKFIRIITKYHFKNNENNYPALE